MSLPQNSESCSTTKNTSFSIPDDIAFTSTGCLHVAPAESVEQAGYSRAEEELLLRDRDT